MLLESLDIVLQVSSPTTWITHFVNTGLAQKSCDVIDEPKTGGPELAAYDTLLARVILREPTAFATFVNAYAQTQVTANAVAKQLELTIDAMWRAYEYVGDAKRRKMIAMAFANLLLLVSSGCTSTRSKARLIISLRLAGRGSCFRTHGRGIW